MYKPGLVWERVMKKSKKENNMENMKNICCLYMMGGFVLGSFYPMGVLS